LKTKDEIIKLLVKQNRRRDQCILYADCYLEYQEATDNIEKNGLIVQHPRTTNPITNPYVAIRDRALLKIQKLREPTC
jgi:phage terminase small subunit